MTVETKWLTVFTQEKDEQRQKDHHSQPIIQNKTHNKHVLRAVQLNVEIIVQLTSLEYTQKLPKICCPDKILSN
jgi:hypothetical protein